MSIPLTAIYTPVDLESSTSEMLLPIASTDSVEVPKKKCKKSKCKAARCCCRLIVKLFLFCVVTSLVGSAMMMMTGMYVGHQVKKCVNSKHYVTESYMYNVNDIKTIDATLVNGMVQIIERDGDAVEVEYKRSARHEDMLYTSDMTISGYLAADGVLKVEGVSPRFSPKTCELTSVTIYLPSSHEPINFIGDVLFGCIDLDATTRFDKIDAHVMVGGIQANYVSASEMNLNTEVGFVGAYSSVAEDMTLTSVLGFVHAAFTNTNNLKIAVEYGSTKIQEVFIGNMLESTVKFGYSTVLRPVTETGDLKINTFYGKTLVALEQEYDINFIGPSEQYDSELPIAPVSEVATSSDAYLLVNSTVGTTRIVYSPEQY